MRIIVLTLLLTIVASCAQIVPLEGGDKDIHAPALDSSKSYP
jgi:hypothetical protein